MGMNGKIVRSGLFLSLITAVLFCSPAFVSAVGPEWWEVLAKATPDECFYGVGEANDYPLISDCIDGRLKRNEAYVWGLTQFEDNIFFGTGANIHCLVIRGYLGQEDAVETEDYVCEAGEAVNLWNGDNRPPSLYMYNLSSRELKKLNSGPLVYMTGGIRSAGAHPDGVVFLAGPGKEQVNFFAYNGTSGDFLGSVSLPDYSNIRKWLVGSDGNLYLGVGSGEGDTGSGAVLKWAGDSDAILGDPANLETLFDFEIVGAGLDGDAAELAEHEGRLYVTTWPNLQAWPPMVCGLWMSPELPLHASDNTSWQKHWRSSDYDPDPVTAATYGGGGLASFDGWLYWGTMHVPGVAALAHMRQYNKQPENEDEFVDLMLGTWRSISIFRGRGFASGTPEIELLYGGSPRRVESPSLFNPFPLYNPGYFRAYNPATGNWETARNKMGLTPLYGRGGFDNHYNNYCWTMQVYHGELYVGTMDHSYLLKDYLEEYSDISYFLDDENYGADLFKFTDTRSSASPVSRYGMDNIMNYGIRTMITNGSHLFLGTANPMNLNPQGGWELIGLDTPRTRIPFVTGLRHDGARMLIDQADLDHDPERHITYICSDSIDDNMVTSQSPTGGRTADPGSTVHLTVTAPVDGSCPVVPSCISRAMVEAVEAIEDAGLSVGTVTYKCAKTEEGTVILQHPKAGMTAMPDSSVDLVVSSGACPVVPKDPGSGEGSQDDGGNGEEGSVPGDSINDTAPEDDDNDYPESDESETDNGEQEAGNPGDDNDKPESDDSGNGNGELESDIPDDEDEDEDQEQEDLEESDDDSSSLCFVNSLR